MPRPSRPTLGQLAYEEFCRYHDEAFPAWGDLVAGERLAWVMAVKRAIYEARWGQLPRVTTSPHHRWESIDVPPPSPMS